MTLDVLPSDPAPWYADGLNFTCTQCGNCCTGGPGFVWISREEVVRLAEFLRITPEETVEQYCRTISGNLSLNERRTREGSYDCIFLHEEKVTDTTGGKKVVQTKRTCSIYAVRPLQCRSWPFWPELLRDPQNWKRAGRRCPGIDAGTRHFSLKQIETIRDAKDWPDRPPTSATRKG